MSLDIKHNVEKLLLFSFSLKVRVVMRFPAKNTLSCLWCHTCLLTYWYTCGTDGRTVGGTVKWLPKFLECIDYKTFLGMGLRWRALRAPGFICLAEEVLFSMIVNNFQKGVISKDQIKLNCAPLAGLWKASETWKLSFATFTFPKNAICFITKLCTSFDFNFSWD